MVLICFVFFVFTILIPWFIGLVPWWIYTMYLVNTMTNEYGDYSVWYCGLVMINHNLYIPSQYIQIIIKKNNNNNNLFAVRNRSIYFSAFRCFV